MIFPMAIPVILDLNLDQTTKESQAPQHLDQCGGARMAGQGSKQEMDHDFKQRLMGIYMDLPIDRDLSWICLRNYGGVKYDMGM